MISILFICFFFIDVRLFDVIFHDGAGALAGSPLQFFLASRVANGLTCLSLFLLVPALRRHLWALRRVPRRVFATAFVGECLSMTGVCLVTFSYAGFYEPSVVNAVEGAEEETFRDLQKIFQAY